ncbi:MAG: NAD+ synthase [Alphaproteobacteria bacterium]|nr:NAD+ synthase [Alphaproteobacteria bacterium]
MTDTLTIALAQMNPTVGDIAGNVAKLRAARAAAAKAGADLVLAPELFISGYPPEDLIKKPAFLDAIEAAVMSLAAETADGGPAVLVGCPWRPKDAQSNKNPELDNPAVGLKAGALYNAVLLLDQGRVAAVRAKVDLPNYGVFDEKRLFTAGPLPGPINMRGVRIGAPICEDIWTPDVVECLAESGAELLLVPNGSPFEAGKYDTRIQLAVARTVESDLPIAYLNQVCGQDELVFDGASFVMNADRSLAVQMPGFAEHLEVTRWSRTNQGWRCAPGTLAPPPDGLPSIYQALILGLRDYVGKNRFPGVLLGLSGGIDSALTAAVAADALGPERVHAVMMPSRYTSRESLDDAEAVAKLLGIRYETIAIEPAVAAFTGMLAPAFAGRKPDLTEENLQSRIRGVTLMALSNKLGAMVVSTGNKSEMSTGYATLYGDMCGGYALLKDVYKTTVFALCRWRNQALPPGALGPAGRVMPERVITKPPTAELREGQTDEASLGAYSQLDQVLEGLIEREESVEQIAARGFDRAYVQRVWRMLDLAEYKRRQAPPGVKITARSLSRDRRYPITNAFRG